MTMTSPRPSEQDGNQPQIQPQIHYERGVPTQNIPVPDPSVLTTAQLHSSIDTLHRLLETQIDSIRRDQESFQRGHEEKHTSVVNAAIQHRKELSDASVAIVQAQVDAQFSSQQSQLKGITNELNTRFASSDLRYQQRYDAQSEALTAAFEAQQKATSAALAAAKEAVQTALAASEKAVNKAEATTGKLIPRAEVESRFTDVSHQIDKATSVTETRLGAILESIKSLTSLSDRLEKTAEAVNGLDRVTDAKFVTFRTLIDSQADKVALALAASNKAVDAAFASSAAAILKAEVFAEKRFDIITKQIDELKTYRDASGGKGEGATMIWGFIAGGIGLLATVIGIFFALSGGR